MLALDWLGCVVTACALTLVLRGRWRPLRALGAIAMGEAGRLGLALGLFGQVDTMTIAGAFGHVSAGPAVSDMVVPVAGVWVGTFVALLMGRRRFKDGLVYALLVSAAAVWMSV